ncbi:hypothetical protein LXA43DRAFT_1096318 [Ganoderma leucocontextum]|nr:hypothetical protein LXA43DRAFT_1096318 [Ganoderma leucocontextum]
MAAPYPIELAQLVAQAGDLHLYEVHKHIQTAAITCCMLEAVATLPDEVRYLWPSEWSLMKVVYLVNKYSPLIDVVLLVLVDIVSHDPQACAVRFQLLTYWFLVGTLFSEFILIARTYALWGCNKLILYFTLFAAALMIPHSFYVVYDMLRLNLKSFADNGPVIRALGCMPAINDSGCWPAFVYLICAELMVVLLTLLKRYLDPVAFGDSSSYSSVLLYTMYRDGTWFWGIVLVFSIVNLLVMFLAPRELRFSMQHALCTRVLLNLRKAAASASNSRADEFTVMTTLALESLPMFAPGGDEDPEGEEAYGGPTSSNPFNSYALTRRLNFKSQVGKIVSHFTRSTMPHPDSAKDSRPDLSGVRRYRRDIQLVVSNRKILDLAGHKMDGMTTNGALLLSETLPSATSLYLYQVSRLLQYISFASMTYSVLEIVSTLPDEVEFIWPAKRGFMKTVFLINKYSPLIDFTLLVLVELAAREPEPHAFYIIFDTLWESDFKSGQEVTRLIGCMPNIHDRDTWPTYTYLICGETMVVILTVLKRYVDPEIVEGSFASVVLPTMYRDGTCFWAAVLALSILNILMMFFAPGGLSYSMQMPLRVVHSALCNRVLLNLRKAAGSMPSQETDSSGVLTTVEFQHEPITSVMDLESRGDTLTSYTLGELGYHES